MADFVEELNKFLMGYAIGGATRPDSFTGMDHAFSSALAKAMKSAPESVRKGTRFYSGYRSPQKQAELYEKAVKRYGPTRARRYVAPPGRSYHNHGQASDLKFLSPEAKKWWHANAANFGLKFPMGHEPWHVEPSSTRSGKKLKDAKTPTPDTSMAGAIDAQVNGIMDTVKAASESGASLSLLSGPERGSKVETDEPTGPFGMSATMVGVLKSLSSGFSSQASSKKSSVNQSHRLAKSLMNDPVRQSPSVDQILASIL